MLRENTLFGPVDKVQIAIARLKEFEPDAGYYLAFSGGKDSVVLYRLAEMSGVAFDAHYSVTTIDPPELVRFMRKEYPTVHWERPDMPFLRKLETKGFPLRHARWCCEHYKENGGNNRMVLTGIRWAESYNRSTRKMVEPCVGGGYKGKNKFYIHPIIDWTDEDVWEFIHEEDVPYCSLYDEGAKRLGCLFCPMARPRDRKADALRYPRYTAAFIKAFEHLYQKRLDQGKESVLRWPNGEAMFNWWLGLDHYESRAPKEQVMLFE